MLCAAIRQTLFCQNVSRENSSNFNDIKVSRYTVLQVYLSFYASLPILCTFADVSSE